MAQLINQYSKRLLKSNTEGLTLIELLIVLVMIGILSAIALPSILNHSIRAKEATAQNNVGAINRAQQVYRLEYPEFASDPALLGTTVTPSNADYTYSFGDISTSLAEYKAQPTTTDIQAFTGCVTANVFGNQATTTATIIPSPAGGGGPATPPEC